MMMYFLLKKKLKGCKRQQDKRIGQSVATIQHISQEQQAFFFCESACCSKNIKETPVNHFLS